MFYVCTINADEKANYFKLQVINTLLLLFHHYNKPLFFTLVWNKDGRVSDFRLTITPTHEIKILFTHILKIFSFRTFTVERGVYGSILVVRVTVMEQDVMSVSNSIV